MMIDFSRPSIPVNCKLFIGRRGVDIVHPCKIGNTVSALHGVLNKLCIFCVAGEEEHISFDVTFILIVPLGLPFHFL